MKLTEILIHFSGLGSLVVSPDDSRPALPVCFSGRGTAAFRSWEMKNTKMSLGANSPLLQIQLMMAVVCEGRRFCFAKLPTVLAFTVVATAQDNFLHTPPQP